MAAKNYYDLLELPATATADEVKRAFRQQIARYHPDKVQHLGKEFQTLAADRAAELTEAYRILSSTALREEYDRSRHGESASAPPAAKPSGPAEGAEPAAPNGRAPRTAQDASSSEPLRFTDTERWRIPTSEQPPATRPHSEDRATGNAVLKKATVVRVRQALATTFGNFDDSSVRGFDLAFVPKPKLFSRARPPRVLVRFVSCVDGAAVGDAWAQAAKWNVPPAEEVCLFLMGPTMVSQRELADAIHEQRRKPARSAKMTLIPVDTRDWKAYMPLDAPAAARTVLEYLRTGS